MQFTVPVVVLIVTRTSYYEYILFPCVCASERGVGFRHSASNVSRIRWRVENRVFEHLGFGLLRDTAWSVTKCVFFRCNNLNQGKGQTQVVWVLSNATMDFRRQLAGTSGRTSGRSEHDTTRPPVSDYHRAGG